MSRFVHVSTHVAIASSVQVQHGVQRLREASALRSLLELMLRLRCSAIELSGGTSSPAIAAAQSV